MKSLPQSDKVTVATQTGCSPASVAPTAGNATGGANSAVTNAGSSGDALTPDPHCYECRVRYRDPRPRDLVMYLHAWKYKVKLCVLTYFYDFEQKRRWAGPIAQCRDKRDTCNIKMGQRKKWAAEIMHNAGKNSMSG